MTRKEAHAYTAAAIYAAIAFLMLGCASVGAYGLFEPQAAPALVFVIALFTLFGIVAGFAAICAAKGAQ